MKILCQSLGLVALVLIQLPLAAAEMTDEGSFRDDGVTAHRGNSGEYPENTLPAFQSAIDLGVGWIELDLFRTKDGELVVIHDETTGRVGNRDLVVAESDYADLSSVDVAFDFRRRTGKTLEECPPQTMPRLEDVLRLVIAQDRTRVSLQPKMDCVADAVAVVRQLEAERWVGFNDGHLPFMAKVKQLAPSIPVFWDRPNDANLEVDLRIARSHGFESLVLHHEAVTPEKIRAIKAAGFEAGAWTVNEPVEMSRMLDAGVDHIYTDEPRRLLAIKAGRGFQTVNCDGSYPKHLQGICTNDQDSIFWCFTDELVKTDLDGTVRLKRPVANHHGDLCFHDGKVYVAVNLGKFNQPAGQADSWVYVYDAATLEELARHAVPEVVHGAGGIAYQDGKFLVVGGLPDGIEENFLYEYDFSFVFQKRHVLRSGWTQLGIQTATFADGHWWFGCYGTPRMLLKADPAFRMVGKWEFDASLGLVGLPDGRLLAATGQCGKAKQCTGAAMVVVPDAEKGLAVDKPDPR